MGATEPQNSFAATFGMLVSYRATRKLKVRLVKPKTRVLTLLFALILPYLAVVMYFATRIQEHPLPTWFPYFGLSYMLGTILLVTAFSKRIHRKIQAETLPKPGGRVKS